MAALADLRPGHVLLVMQSRGCLTRGQLAEVEADRHGDLYVCCLNGRHYLEHEANAAGQLPGLEVVATETVGP